MKEHEARLWINFQLYRCNIIVVVVLSQPTIAVMLMSYGSICRTDQGPGKHFMFRLVINVCSSGMTSYENFPSGF